MWVLRPNPTSFLPIILTSHGTVGEVELYYIILLVRTQNLQKYKCFLPLIRMSVCLLGGKKCFFENIADVLNE